MTLSPFYSLLVRANKGFLLFFTSFYVYCYNSEQIPDLSFGKKVDYFGILLAFFFFKFSSSDGVDRVILKSIINLHNYNQNNVTALYLKERRVYNKFN